MRANSPSNSNCALRLKDDGTGSNERRPRGAEGREIAPRRGPLRAFLIGSLEMFWGGVDAADPRWPRPTSSSSRGAFCSRERRLELHSRVRSAPLGIGGARRGPLRPAAPLFCGVRGGGLSKSATKAPRAGIGSERRRGIPTILLARLGSVGAFVADLDSRRPRAGRGGRPRVGRRARRPPGRPRPSASA